MNDDVATQLLVAIRTLQDATIFNFGRLESRFDTFEREVNHRFAEVHREFGKVYLRFDAIDERLGRLERPRKRR
jgi:hypothetical protein